jgi:hypothetical protein
MNAEQFDLKDIYIRNYSMRKSMIWFLQDLIRQNTPDLYSVPLHIWNKEVIIFPNKTFYIHNSSEKVSLNYMYENKVQIQEIIAQRMLDTLNPWIAEEIKDAAI